MESIISPMVSFFTTTSVDPRMQTLAATFFAFLPFILHLFSMPPPKAETNQAQVEKTHVPTLAWFVSDIEAEILEVLSESGKEMSSFEIARILNYWPENVHTTLYGLHERGIICMRGVIPLWSIPA